jgi:hypothetical protein
MRRLLLYFLLFLSVTGANGQKGWKWEKSVAHNINGGLEWCAKLILSTGADGEIVVPETKTIKGEVLPVMSVWSPFIKKDEKKPHYTKIVLPKNIVEATLDSRELQEIVFQDGMSYLHELAIKSSYVKKLVFPNTVRRIRSIRNFFSNMSVVLPQQLQIVDDEAFYNCKLEGSLIFPSKMISIGAGAFSPKKYCEKNIDEIVLPQEIEYIGEYAFNGISTLSSISLPKKVNKVGRGILANDNSIVKHNLNKNSLPQWILNASVGGTIGVFVDNVKNSYSYYMQSKKDDIIANVNVWQKKGEFETVEEWKGRVNEISRKQYVAQITQQLRKKYIDENKPKIQDNYSLCPYDIENEVFPIKVGNKDTIFVKVPRGDAPDFKSNFKNEYIVNQYDIVDDHVSRTGIACIVDGRNFDIINEFAKADAQQDLALNLPPLEMNFGNVSNNTSGQKTASTPVDRTIDQNIPASGITNSNTFAVIIGNEDYEHVAKVAYAKNDARVFAEYCRKTLGLPAKNVRGYENATYGKLLSAVQDIKDIAKAYNGDINIVFYYAGHGMPYGSQGEAYLLPVDADGRQINICYSLSKLYEELGALNAKSVTVLMDACFSGAQRGDGMLMAARAVALKPKVNAPRGNMVVMTAANGEQTAFPYNEKGHGMFTYYLLKKLRDTKGDCTLGELGNYIKTEVAKQAIVTNGREQTPALLVSPNISGSWQTMKLK